MHAKPTRLSFPYSYPVVMLVALVLAFAAPRIFAEPQITIKARFVQFHPDSFLPEHFGWFSDAVRTNLDRPFSATLTEAQFRDVLKALQQNHSGDLLNEGQVTTLSGRSAQFQITDVPTNSSAAQQQVVQPFDTNWTGVMLDIDPEIAGNNSAIQLKLVATVNEPLGKLLIFTRPPNPPEPVLATWQFTNNCTVLDGQTVMFGGPAIIHSKDKMPFLGDLPSVGRLFRSQSSETNNIWIFVTPTLIDAAGNRIH